MVSNDDYNRDYECIILLFNKLFDIFDSNRLIDLESLTNEHLIKKLLLEIEPKIEEIGGKIEITLDNNFGIRYANIVSIIKTLENYFEKSAEKSKFNQDKLDLKKNIKINDLLKNDKSQVLQISEILIFISAISSRVNYYLDKLEDAEDRLVNTYCHISDKYMSQNENTLNMSITSFHHKSSITFEESRNSQVTRQLQNQLDRLNRKIEETQREKESGSKTIHDLEKENSYLILKLNNLEKSYLELELQYKDSRTEIINLKTSSKSNIQVQQELLQESFLIAELKSQISNKDMEIEDLKKDHDLQIKSLNEIINTLNEKLDIYEDKLSSIKNLSNENDKLKIKIKELSFLKEKQLEYDELVLNVEIKSRTIDNLIKEKQTYISQIEKANKEILTERDKYRQAEYERKKLDFELKDLKGEFNRLEQLFKNKEIQFQNLNTLNEIKKNNLNTIDNFTDRYQGNYLMDLDQSSVMYEIDKTKDDRIKLLEREIDELRSEKLDLINNYKIMSDDINNKISEKEKLFSQVEEFNFELKRMTNEKDKYMLEKEKLLLKVQKIELDFQKKEIIYESEKKKSDDDLKETFEKLKRVLNEKNNILREIENLKNENNNKIEKLKLSLETNFQKEFEKSKNFYEKEINFLKIKNSNKGSFAVPSSYSSNANAYYNKDTSNTSKDEISELKLEIQNLKSILAQKDDQMKSLLNKINSLEGEGNSLSQNMQDSVDKFNQDILKRSEDLEFYKRSYEEQKNRVNREHELISSSLYELALQFMSLKTELQKKVTNSSSNKNWLENERNKNFPLEK